MRHRGSKKILSRKSAARNSLMRNLATSLILYEKIKTTEAKAKQLRSEVEKLVTLGKVKNLTNRKKLLGRLYVKKAADKIFDVLGPRYKDRKGGYTTTTKLYARKGDSAEMVLIQFVK